MTDLTWVLSSCVLILAVIAIRATFGKRMNPKLRYALWGLVLLRLLYPGTVLSSPVSVQGVAEQTEVVQNFEAVRGVDSIEHMANGSVEGFDRYALMPERPVTVAEQVTPERFARMETTIRARDMLEPIWIVGIVVTAIAFLISNLRFYHTLRKRRKPLDADCPLRVYSVENLSSSCLFGSAIYVAAETAADETRLRHVLAHDRVDVRAVLYERIIVEREGRVVVYAPECGRQSCRRESHGHSASPDMGSTGAQRR